MNQEEQYDHISLFSGQGGFDLAAQWAGFNNVAHCEISKFCQKILKYYWPHSELINDIKEENFLKYANRIDVLSGGFPCQGFSLAGERLGTEDDRYLWPEMRRAYKAIRPTAIVAENVTGILSMEDKSGLWKEVFPKVENRKITRFIDCDHYEAIYSRQAKMLINSICEDLEEDGYQVQPIVIPACAVGAPHKRDRVWILAISSGPGLAFGQEPGFRQEELRSERPNKNVPDSGDDEGRISVQQRRKMEEADLDSSGICSAGNDPDSESFRMERDRSSWEQEPGSQTQQKLSGCYASAHDWGNWPTVAALCSGDDGLSSRLDSITFPKWREESIRSGGNAIVPQVALELFQSLKQTFKNYNYVAKRKIWNESL